MAFSWEILLIVASSKPSRVTSSSSGAFGQVPSECGKSDSQQTLSMLKWWSSSTPTVSLMKQTRMWSLKICVGLPVLEKSWEIQPPWRSLTCSARQSK